MNKPFMAFVRFVVDMIFYSSIRQRRQVHKRICVSRGNSSPLRELRASVVQYPGGPTHKRIERLEHLERMELAQRGYRCAPRCNRKA
jgi:hypothetical protein